MKNRNEVKKRGWTLRSFHYNVQVRLSLKMTEYSTNAARKNPSDSNPQMLLLKSFANKCNRVLKEATTTNS